MKVTWTETYEANVNVDDIANDILEPLHSAWFEDYDEMFIFGKSVHEAVEAAVYENFQDYSAIPPTEVIDQIVNAVISTHGEELEAYREKIIKRYS